MNITSASYRTGKFTELTMDSCGCAFDGIVLGILKEIVALPDASGKHACEECGHPEMRRLPDETFHCPDCGSEVLPIFPSSESK